MHHKTKEKYLNLKESGLTAEELKEQMIADGVELGEVEPFIVKAYTEAQETPSGEEKEQPAPQEPKASKPVQKTESANSVYEEWKMSLSHDLDGNPVLEKVKKVKDVKITHDRAERLNEQAMNRKVKYFLKQN